MLTAIKKKLSGLKPKKLNLGAVAAVIVFLLLAVSVVESYIAIGEKQAQLEELDAMYNEQLMVNAELSALLDESGDEYIIRIARERLDLVFPGERVFINSSGN